MSFQQPSSASLIWFLLLDSVTGEPYKSTTASSILYSSLIVPVIADFRDAVKAKNSSILSSFDAADLLIFKNKYYFDKRNAIDGKEEPLAPTEYIGSLGSKEDMLVVIVSQVTIQSFLSNTLADIPNFSTNPSTTETKRNFPKKPLHVERWKEFKIDAASYDYPTTSIGSDIILPVTTLLEFNLERDVDKIIGNHLDNFNRIFRVEGKSYKLRSRADDSIRFVGIPDYVLIFDSKVLSFIELKTPTDLPVRHVNGKLFDLLDIYKEDIEYQETEKARGDIGRMDVCTLIDQVYGYLSLNNLIYGCVTCYDATYFLWRPKMHTLLISDPIYNSSSSPSFLQSMYYFVQLAVNGIQTLTPSPTESEIPVENTEMDIDKDISGGQSDSGSNYSTTEQKGKNNSSSKNSKSTTYNLNLNSLHSGTVVGYGATGQVILLKDRNIVVKQCDTYNNPEGFEMLKNEISIYEKLSPLNLNYIPRYYGECEYYGQYFIALEYIPGNHCNWRRDRKLKDKLDLIIRDLKSVGVKHQDLRPENVLLTSDGDIKLIDFGEAEIIC